MAGAATSVNLCRAQLRLQPAPGSEIKVEVWLPGTWNGKLMGFGGAGFDGGLSPGGAPLFNQAVERGYTIVANDAGHKAGSSIESWVHRQPERVVDFGHRANHLAAVAAKQVIAAYYGKAARHASFFGCSNGGRDGLMLATRYPEDYDSIIAGAPARRYTAILTQLHWYTQAIHGPTGAPNLASKLGFVQDAVLDKCDAIDGVTDRVLENPLLCSFDASTLQCNGADAPTCLTESELVALRKIYGGPRLRNDARVISGPAMGSEAGPEWKGWVTTTQGTMFGQEFYRWFVYDDPAWTIESFDLDRDYAVARERVAPVLDVESADLSAFTSRGGKLILYQGWDDPGIPPAETIEYYEDVLRRIGPGAASQVRLFMVPSMGHCAGGPGATSFDMQAVLERWVDHGEAPERVVAVKPDSGDPSLTHPLCVWPETAHYTGNGSTRDAVSFVCKAPN
jgi:feruloyl esterase